MSDKVIGRPFTKNDPRRGKSPGRPKKTVTWREAEDLLRATVPLLIVMSDKELKALMNAGPGVAEQIAIAYIQEHPVEVINRFLGKTATPITGADGKPFMPPSASPVTFNLPPIDFSGPLWTAERLDKFIELTGKR